MFAPSPCHPRESGDPGATLADATLGPRFPGDDKGELDLLALDPHERAAAGLFLGFQYPVEIPGVSNVQFLRESLNAQRKARGQEPLSAGAFLKLAREKRSAEHTSELQSLIRTPYAVSSLHKKK